MATMKDVARHAGVSTSTVSRVLNGGFVSTAATRRVMEAMDALGYQISTSARSLKSEFTNIIGVTVVDISNPSTTRMLHGITSVFHEHGMSVMLTNTDGNPEIELESIEMFARQRVSGIIYTGSHTREDVAAALNAFPAPVVIGGQEAGIVRWPVVVFDNYKAGIDITSALLNLGHREIGYISAHLEDEHTGRFRRKGYMDALASAGIRPSQGCIQYADFTVDSGHAAMERMLEETETMPTAVAAASDMIAIGALRCLQQHGIEVPGMVSLAGFDDIPVSSKLIPSLSSVSLDVREMGEMCAELLYRMIRKKNTVVERVVLGHRIVQRESLGPYP
jgi:LacI family transcriptional regulator